ncbi:MAG TPA: extracellular solute-binding protein [Bacillales bacterium]
MKQKLVSVATAAMLLMSFALAGCSSGGDGNGSSGGDGSKDITTITLWHMENTPQRIERFNKVFEKFNESHPNIKIKAQAQSWDDAYSEIPAAIRAGNGPDLLFTLPDYTTLIKKLGVVQPVDDIVKTLDDKYHFLKSSLAPYQYGGHTWAVPAYGMVQVLWYRKDKFEKAGLEPPKTWDDLLKATKKLSSDGAYGIALPASKSLATDQVIYSFMVAGGAKEIIDENNKVTFNKPETVKAYKFYAELLNYSPKDSTTFKWAEPQALFNKGKAAMAVEKGQYLSPFEKKSGQPASNLGVVPVPSAENGEQGSIYYSNGMMVLTKDKEKQRAIAEFLKYLYKPKNYSEFVNADPGLFLPVTKAGLNAESYWKNPVISKYKDQVKVLLEAAKNGYLFGFVNGVSTEVGSISGPNYLAQTLQKIVVDGMSPKEAVEWGQKQMEKAVE